MNETIVPKIETNRLLLREITADDLDGWTDILFADKDVMRYMPVRDMTPQERAARAYNFHKEIWSDHNYGHWLVTNKDTGQLLGDCYLEPEDKSGSGEIEIGYTIAKAYWGQGIATEATRAVVRYAFEVAHVTRIVGVAMPDNIGSWRVLEHAGFSFEKEAHLYDLDVLVYAIDHRDFRPGSAFFRVQP